MWSKERVLVQDRCVGSGNGYCCGGGDESVCGSVHISGSGGCGGLSILRLMYGPGVPSFRRFLLPFVLPCIDAHGFQAVSRRNPHWTVSQALIPQPKNILNIRIPILQSE